MNNYQQRGKTLNPKIPLIISLIITAIIAVYAVELSFRTFAGLRRPEYLIAVTLILAVLLVLDWWLYRRSKKHK